jgi:DNA transposition AAA+ family ATPase
MKIKREIEFTPITIILESEQEADNLWHILNCANGMSLEDYNTEHDKDFEKYPLWLNLDSVYRPEGE